MISESEVKEAIELLVDYCTQFNKCSECQFFYDGYTKIGEPWCKLRRISVENWKSEILESEE